MQLRTIGRARQRHRSGSTLHDCPLPIPTPRCWSFLSLPITPARDCSPKYRARPSNKCFQLHTSITKPILSNPPSAFTSLKLQFSLCVPSHQCGPLSAQIPIAEHAARRGPPRVPNARFPPLEVFVRRPPEYVALSGGAGIRKPSQERTHAPQQNWRGAFNSRVDFAPKRPEVDCFCQFRRALDGSRWRRSDHCVTATITIKVLVYEFSSERGDKPPLRAQP